MIQSIQEIFPLRNWKLNIEIEETNQQLKINEIRQRQQFFHNLFVNNVNNGRNHQFFVNNIDQLNNQEIFDIYQEQQNDIIPSLFKFEHYFMPFILYDPIRFQQSAIQQQQLTLNPDAPENLITNTLTDLTFDTQNVQYRNINPNPLNRFRPQQDEFNDSMPSYIRQQLNGIINNLQHNIQDYEKILIKFQVVFANDDLQQDELRYLRYQRLWSNIDKQIVELQFNINNLNNAQRSQLMVERQHFDFLAPQIFQLNADTDDPIQNTWFRIVTFNLSMRQNNGDENLYDDHDQEFRVTYSEDLEFMNQQLIRILGQINQIFIDFDVYGEDWHPTFLRRIRIFGIKEFTQNLINNPNIPGEDPLDQPQVNFPENIQQIYSRFLNGLIAFDSNKINDINQYDINNHNKQQHCLMRILFYFEYIKNPQISMHEFIQLNLHQILQTRIGDQLDDLNKMFLGHIDSLVKLLYKRYNVLVGIYMIDQTQQLFDTLEYQLIIKNNHCVLSKKEIVDQIKKQQLFTKPFIMKKKDPNPNSKKNIAKLKNQLPPVINWYFDTETYNDSLERETIKEGKQGVFLICVINDQGEKIHYSDNNCIQLFLKLVDQMLDDNKNTHVIWSFNGGKFDYLFLIVDIIRKYSNLQIIGSDTDLKQIQINNVYFKDIKYIFTQGSLKDQAKQWNIQQQKQDFDIKNWSYSKYQDQEQFQKVLEYCYQDCNVLKQIVEKFYDLINREFKDNIFNSNKEKLDIRNIFSSSSLTMTIFRQFYLKYDLKSNYDREFYEIERKSYYGGITMNFQKQGENLYYYDINSSYPFVMKNCLIPISPIDNLEQQYTILPPNFGILYVIDYHLYEVEVEFHPSIKITTLPTRTKDGLIYLKQVPISWRWGCELKLINHYKLAKNIKYHRSLKYKGEPIFKEFIEDLYSKRLATDKDDLKMFYKNLMNGGYGKYGQKEFGTHKYVHELQLEEHLRHPLVKDLDQISDDIYKITYAQKQNLNFTGSLVRIASFITAMARVNLMNAVYKLKVKNVFYVDTDSIICSVPMNQQDVGNELGQWKLETMITKGIFIAPKIYQIFFDKPDKKGKICQMKCKGIRNDALNDDIFGQLLNKKHAEMTNESTFQRKFGEIFISDQKKLIRILDLKRIWLNDNESIPYNTLNDYLQDQKIKQEQNDELLINKNYQKIINDNVILNKKMKQIYLKHYNKVINDQSEVNLKRRTQYIELGEQQFLISKKIFI